jgi:protein-S-isoprenylcysteine O-methyltransferase Ste14
MADQFETVEFVALPVRLPCVYGCGMTNFADRPNTIHWPPILYVMALLLPWLLQTIIPLPIIAPGRIWDDLMFSVGWALVATGVTIGWLALKSFTAFGTPFDPTARAEKLVTFGLYNRSRNPMYLAAVIAFFGLAVATGNVWRFAVLPVLCVGLQRLAIEREEQHLLARFGEAWTTYSATVRRWW